MALPAQPMALGVSDIAAPGTRAREPPFIVMYSLCAGIWTARKVHGSMYQQSRCSRETNETEVLMRFSICVLLHIKNWNILCLCQVSKRENSHTVWKKKKKAKERWERLIWELRAIRRNGDKIALRHCWHAYCTQAWYICSQIRWMLPTREASFLVLVYLHTQSSVKIVLRLWSDRSYERFGKCFLAFGGGGDKTVKKCSFIKANL